MAGVCLPSAPQTCPTGSRPPARPVPCPALPEASPPSSCPQDKPNSSFLVNHSKVQGEQQLPHSALGTKGSSVVTAGLFTFLLSPLLQPTLLPSSQLLSNDTPKVAEIRAAGDTNNPF